MSEETESTSAALARVTAERDAAKQSLAEALDRADDAERECAEALAKRDHLVEMGNVWIRAAREARAEAERLATVLANTAGAYLTTTTEAAADVVTAYDCLYCRTCYGRYFDGTDAAANHEHPLVPVNVTITLREGHR